jgi:hypothetical protein
MEASDLYTPLDPGRKEIRVVRLLPGDRDSPVICGLETRSLTAIVGKYEALSYEWETPDTANSTIELQGRPHTVRDNLFLALVHIRSRTNAKMLWIDALCINQRDLTERAQQVQFMRDIYRNSKAVMVWLGAALDMTGEAFRIITTLAREYKTIKANSPGIRFDYRAIRKSSDIYHGHELEQLCQQPAWTAVLDLYARSYFRRLWVIQEIMLASTCHVVCGSHRINWVLFWMGSYPIYACAFLTQDVSETAKGNVNTSVTELLPRITHLGNMKDQKHFDLYSLLLISSGADATEPRDRIFGILGMLGATPQKSSIHVDYVKPVEMVYQEAATSIVKFDKHVRFLYYLRLCTTDRQNTSCPSWVPDLDERRVALIWQNLGGITEFGSTCAVQGDSLIIKGFIFDSVVDATRNFTEDNLERQIRDIIKDTSLSSLGHEAKTSILRSLLHFHEGRSTTCDFKSMEKGLKELLAEKHRSVGLNRTKPPLTENATALLRNIKQTMLREPDFGHNLFQVSSGLFGTGPAGRTSQEIPQKAIQIGDFVVIMPGYCMPIILRQLDDREHYCIIGNAYIGGMQKADCLKKGNLPELVELRIR